MIDRIAEDFSTRETFEVPGGGELVAGDGGARGESTTFRGGFQGIRVGSSGDVYFWTNDHVGRVALP